ncbi:hypothetical protein AMS68_006558 [Peltaster fructicola]|uniref:peptidylprolyl isomerase n=1 Tax=Peltaster fructicola TaxID=286661 RepID=A0A6H0Y290_9PEZI|nr:hypothetical protein AMS68_006558 [Peltaster fructicola]
MSSFRQLCTGQFKEFSYAGCPFHRVIDEFMIQGGDIANSDGTGILSIYGKEFEDENLNWRKLDASGLVCSANRGKDTNGSQYASSVGFTHDLDANSRRFFITLEAQPHLNGKHTIFGHLVAGQGVLQKIASVSVDHDDRPNVPVVVSRCGELERKRKRRTEPADNLSVPSSNDRGRRRESHDSDIEMGAEDTAGIANTKGRRQSDNAVDEGIRGRPRKRSKQRADSRHLDEESSSTRHSPVKMHKRKRSSSPSRKPNQDSHLDDRQPDRRRRRSLPNQYDDEREAGPRHQHRHDRRTDRFDGQRSDHRQHDRWRPYQGRGDVSRHSSRYDDGRLGGGGHEDGAPPVKFKGRGVMKYREPDRF